MHQHIVFNTLHRGKSLAASVPATSVNRLAWLGVYPLDLEKATTREFLYNHGIELIPSSGRAYRVRSFEVQCQLIEADASIGETDLENASSVVVFSDEDLVKEVESRGVSIEHLQLPYKTNYPI